MKQENKHIDIYSIEGLSCAACASSSQKVLSKVKGVKNARVNYATACAVIDWEEDADKKTMAELNERLNKLDFNLYERDTAGRLEQKKQQLKDLQQLKTKVIVSAIFALPLFVIGMFFMDMPYGNYIMLGLALPIVLWSGLGFYQRTFQQLRYGRTNMDTLITLGVWAAFLVSLVNTFAPTLLLPQGGEMHLYYETAGIVITFVLLGKYWEERAKKQTSDALLQLLDLQANTAILFINEEEREMPLEAIQEGDILVVKSGSKVPLDGVVIDGQSDINESAFTGESLPVSKKAGDEVIGGTINGSGNFKMRVERVGEETILAQIIQLVEEAQNSQAPIQRLVDKVSSIFVPVVILIALATFSIWIATHSLNMAVLNAVAVLVVACPCALGLATPMAIMVGIGRAAEKGILIKGAEVLEKAKHIDTIALDKTGTITEGRPYISGIKWQFFLAFGVRNLEKIFLALEQKSNHPLANMVVEIFKKQGIDADKEVTEFENIAGMGITGVVEEQRYYVGNRRLIEEKGIAVAVDIGNSAQEFLDGGNTVVYFANKQTVLAVIAFNDAVKPSSKFAIQQLQKDMEVLMLTGDNPKAAENIARQVGISQYRASLLPQDKIEQIKTLQEQGKHIAMVGDGINDAPALAQAELGIAMNNGTDIAIESADVVLRHNDLQQIQTLFSISEETLKTIRQNLFWAFFYNALSLPIAAGLLYPLLGIIMHPMIAGGAMAFSSISVVLNSLRLARRKF